MKTLNGMVTSVSHNGEGQGADALGHYPADPDKDWIVLVRCLR